MSKKVQDSQVKMVMFAISSPRPKWVLMKALENLPEDAVIVNCMNDFSTQRWGLVVRSKEYQEVPEGNCVPTIELMVDGIKHEVKSSKSIMDAMKDL